MSARLHVVGRYNHRVNTNTTHITDLRWAIAAKRVRGVGGGGGLRAVSGIRRMDGCGGGWRGGASNGGRREG